MTITELVELYGSMVDIPQDVLYDYLQKNKEDLATIPFDELRSSPLGQHVINLCKTDLFWMCRYFTWETNPVGAGNSVEHNLITEDPYRVICDFFVKKDPNKQIHEQDEIKNRLLLWPRGGMKSTIDIVDTVQWILNFPEIRVLYLTATDELAVKFVEETKGHFVLKPNEHSLMNIFFPDFCVPQGQREAADRFECPVWLSKGVKRGEPTVLAVSVGASKSGLHCEVVKGDDPVSDVNSSSIEMCQKISKAIDLTRKLLRLGGYYYDLIGTRYDDEDHYGVTIDKNVGEITTTSGRNWTLSENKTTATKILIGVGITIKPEVAKSLQEQGKKINYAEAGEDGCVLLLPKVMPYKWCMQEWRRNEDNFEAQINQNPRPISAVVFTRQELEAVTVPFNMMPFGGLRSQTWDFAYSTKKGRDFVTGSDAVWDDKGGLVIDDLIRARFKPDELAQAVVDFAKKYHPFVIGIEDASGSKLAEPAIIAKAMATQDPHVIAVCSKIDWIKPNTEIDSKRARMGTMHPWVVEKRLRFASYLPYLPVLYDEFERCMTSKNARNDIPDVISQQLQYAPRIIQQTTENPSLTAYNPGGAAWNQLFEEADQFGRPGFYFPPITVPVTEPEISNVPSVPGLDNILGSGILG